MLVRALYHPNSEFTTAMEAFAKDFKERYGTEVEMISLETVEGSELAKLYGIVTYPAILVTRNDGQLSKAWEGTPFPMIDNVAGYLN